MFNMILYAIIWKYVVLNFYMFTVGISVWLSALEIKLKAISATEPGIDYAMVLSVINSAYGKV